MAHTIREKNQALEIACARIRGQNRGRRNARLEAEKSCAEIMHLVASSARGAMNGFMAENRGGSHPLPRLRSGE